MKLYLELEVDDHDEFTRRMLFLINQGKRFELPVNSLKGNIKVKEASWYHDSLEGLTMNVIASK